MIRFDEECGGRVVGIQSESGEGFTCYCISFYIFGLQ